MSDLTTPFLFIIDFVNELNEDPANSFNCDGIALAFDGLPTYNANYFYSHYNKDAFAKLDDLIGLRAKLSEKNVAVAEIDPLSLQKMFARHIDDIVAEFNSQPSYSTTGLTRRYDAALSKLEELASVIAQSEEISAAATKLSTEKVEELVCLLAKHVQSDYATNLTSVHARQQLDSRLHLISVLAELHVFVIESRMPSDEAIRYALIHMLHNHNFKQMSKTNVADAYTTLGALLKFRIESFEAKRVGHLDSAHGIFASIVKIEVAAGSFSKNWVHILKLFNGLNSLNGQRAMKNSLLQGGRTVHPSVNTKSVQKVIDQLAEAISENLSSSDINETNLRNFVSKLYDLKNSIQPRGSYDLDALENAFDTACISIANLWKNKLTDDSFYPYGNYLQILADFARKSPDFLVRPDPGYLNGNDGVTNVSLSRALKQMAEDTTERFCVKIGKTTTFTGKIKDFQSPFTHLLEFHAKNGDLINDAKVLLPFDRMVENIVTHFTDSLTTESLTEVLSTLEMLQGFCDGLRNQSPLNFMANSATPLNTNALPNAIEEMIRATLSHYVESGSATATQNGFEVRAGCIRTIKQLHTFARSNNRSIRPNYDEPIDLIAFAFKSMVSPHNVDVLLDSIEHAIDADNLSAEKLEQINTMAYETMSSLIDFRFEIWGDQEFGPDLKSGGDRVPSCYDCWHVMYKYKIGANRTVHKWTQNVLLATKHANRFGPDTCEVLADLCASLGRHGAKFSTPDFQKIFFSKQCIIDFFEMLALLISFCEAAVSTDPLMRVFLEATTSPTSSSLHNDGRGPQGHQIELLYNHMCNAVVTRFETILLAHDEKDYDYEKILNDQLALVLEFHQSHADKISNTFPQHCFDSMAIAVQKCFEQSTGKKKTSFFGPFQALIDFQFTDQLYINNKGLMQSFHQMVEGSVEKFFEDSDKHSQNLLNAPLTTTLAQLEEFVHFQEENDNALGNSTSICQQLGKLTSAYTSEFQCSFKDANEDIGMQRRHNAFQQIVVLHQFHVKFGRERAAESSFRWIMQVIVDDITFKKLMRKDGSKSVEYTYATANSMLDMRYAIFDASEKHVWSAGQVFKVLFDLEVARRGVLSNWTYLFEFLRCQNDTGRIARGSFDEIWNTLATALVKSYLPRHTAKLDLAQLTSCLQKFHQLLKLRIADKAKDAPHDSIESIAKPILLASQASDQAGSNAKSSDHTDANVILSQVLANIAQAFETALFMNDLVFVGDERGEPGLKKNFPKKFFGYCEMRNFAKFLVYRP